MRNLNRRSVRSIWTRGATAAAVLALAIQPCVVCLASSGRTATFGAPSHAAAHGADHCGAPSGPMTSGDHAAAPEAADACPSLSARGPEAYTPTAAVPGLPGTSPPVTIAPPAPSFKHAPADPDGLRSDRVPLFLRHASLRI